MQREVNPLALKRKEKLQSRRLISLLKPKSTIAEEYRTIRTNIQFSSIEKDIRTAIVTSSGPEEGKSTTIANLAIVFAQQGKKVLLVDADLRRPTMHLTFSLDNRTGVTNVLTRQATLQQGVRHTEQENLDVLPSGPIPPNPSELLASKMMKTVLEEALTIYDLILFDTPPVLAVTDAQVLANLVDGAILVTDRGKTQIEHAKKAKEQLQNAQAKLLGVILNNKKRNKSKYEYYYGVK
ncbi:polysaccharide biosynthesis tyrosine autokinase [Bacillus sp. FJAT-42376]|uniref:CpsD/CapB family tyrosine-protein kinase n=1 Tax=Bacillus sp. FJAT-42376 TaxID=2014076 RepID=UPI000F5133F2|nr:CpsD/CapB family tyrosine-protein kinase [Bacillus sp. FJAT-42376]AZB44669.1 polysaccharide biosynthesis tyrosine autokinase [Bacillus sp. FJAT-42376]